MSTDLTPSNAQRLPVVFATGGEVFASSRDVAAFFEKRHDNVLRDIDGLLKSEPSLALLKFEETPYTDGQNGKTYRSFNMTRDGFALLAMGFTGAKALKFKLAYIEAFNTMEAELKRLPVNETPEQLYLRAMTALHATVERQQMQLAEALPKADGYDLIADAEGSLCITDAAKALQISPKALFDFMDRNRWTYRRPGADHRCAYQSRIEAADLIHKVSTILRPDGSERICEQVRVTPRGLAKLTSLIGKKATLLVNKAA